VGFASDFAAQPVALWFVLWALEKEVLYCLSVGSACWASRGVGSTDTVEVIVERRVAGTELDEEACVAAR